MGNDARQDLGSASSQPAAAMGRVPVGGTLRLRVPWDTSSLDPHDLYDPLAALFGSAIVAVLLAPRVSRRLGKKHAAITIGIMSAVLAPLPFVLRILDLFPANGSSELLYCLIVYQLIEMSLMITTAILVDSMIADVVEQSQLRTGRRSEGVFFAARSFIRKSVSGVGVLLATTLLTLIDFPTDAKPGMVESGVVDNLGLYYAPAIFVLYMLAIIVIFAYRISQEMHEENVRSLASDTGGINVE